MSCIKEVGQTRMQDGDEQEEEEEDNDEEEEAQSQEPQSEARAHLVQSIKQKSTFNPNSATLNYSSPDRTINVKSKSSDTTIRPHKRTSEVEKQSPNSIASSILSEVISDQNEKTAFFWLLVVIVVFYSEQAIISEFSNPLEFALIGTLFFICIAQFFLQKRESFQYLHIVQSLNCLAGFSVLAVWVYNHQTNRAQEITQAFQQIKNSNFTANIEQFGKSQAHASLLAESKFFYQGAILFKLQECLSKHLFPLYRLAFLLGSTLGFLVIFYVTQSQYDFELDADIWVKCGFLIMILGFSQYVQLKSLVAYLISFQALKKYYTLSLCSSSNHGLSSNMLQIEVNPQNLQECKVIQGNQGLSQLLLSNSEKFFSDFEIDPMSFQCFNEIGNTKQPGNNNSTQHIEKGIQIDDPKIGNSIHLDMITSVTKTEQKNGGIPLNAAMTADQLYTTSRQFIDMKINKNAQRIVKTSNNSLPQSPGSLCLEQEHKGTKNNKSNKSQRKTEQRGGHILMNKVSIEEVDGKLCDENEGKRSRFAPMGDKSIDIQIAQQQNNKTAKSLQQRHKNEETDIPKKKKKSLSFAGKKQRSQTYLAFKTLTQIIKDEKLRSVYLCGKYTLEINGQKQIRYLSITLLKYYNLFQREVVIASITDMTSIEEINNLQREVQFKEKMFANVTHDLRMPLYAIMYSADKLKEIFSINQYSTLLEQRQRLSANVKNLQENEITELHEQINITIANSQLMKAIIQDIIDNNRNRMGKLDPVIHSFDLMEVLAETKKLVEIILWEKRKNIKIQFEISKEVEKNSLIFSDSQRLKQVLMNLVSNAIKFTKRGGILVRVEKVYFKNLQSISKHLNSSCMNSLKNNNKSQEGNNNTNNNTNTITSPDIDLIGNKTIFQLQSQLPQQILSILQGGLIQFQVVDSGIGMSSKVMADLFTPYKTSNKENMNGHGIGLGLTICESIVEKLGPFTLKVASKENRGSKFTFYLYHDLQQTITSQKLDQTPTTNNKLPLKKLLSKNFSSYNNIVNKNSSMLNNNNGSPKNDFQLNNVSANLMDDQEQQQHQNGQNKTDSGNQRDIIPPSSTRGLLQNNTNNSNPEKTPQFDFVSMKQVKLGFLNLPPVISFQDLEAHSVRRDSGAKVSFAGSPNMLGKTSRDKLFEARELTSLKGSQKILNYPRRTSCHHSLTDSAEARKRSTGSKAWQSSFNNNNNNSSIGSLATVHKVVSERERTESLELPVCFRVQKMSEFSTRQKTLSVFQTACPQESTNSPIDKTSKYNTNGENKDFICNGNSAKQISNEINKTTDDRENGVQNAQMRFNSTPVNHTENDRFYHASEFQNFSSFSQKSKKDIDKNSNNNNQNNNPPEIQFPYAIYGNLTTKLKPIQADSLTQCNGSCAGSGLGFSPGFQSSSIKKQNLEKIQFKSQLLDKSQQLQDKPKINGIESLDLDQNSARILSNQSIEYSHSFPKKQRKSQIFMDESALEGDERFNTSVLFSLEDNSERFNFEELGDDNIVRNQVFHVLKEEDEKKQLITTSNGFNNQIPNLQDLTAKKSMRDSQGSEYLEKKGILLGRVDRQNHVTSHKMTDSIQMNQLKKFKYGMPEDFEKEVLSILICDDQSFSVDMLKRMLLNNPTYKMKIDTCLSGEEAIRKFLLKNKPDSLEPYNYIFLDWNMPVMDGYETNSKIKFYVKDESYLDCPIIICSAYDDNAEINKCLRHGTDGILTKPVQQDRLNELLADFQRNQNSVKSMVKLVPLSAINSGCLLH